MTHELKVNPNWAPPPPQALLDAEKKIDAELKGEKADTGDEKGTITVTLEEDAKPTDLLEERKPAPAKDEHEWETMYKVLEGKFSSQDRDQKRQIESLTATITSLQETIANLNALLLKTHEKPAGAGKPDAKQAVDEGGLNPEDYDGYGAEITRMAMKVNTLSKENAELKAKLSKVDRMEESFARSEEQSKEQEGRAWEGRMNGLCPWTEVNESPEFLEWLKQDGGVMLERAQAYSNARLADKLHGVVKMFMKETGWKAAESREGLEGQVVPESHGGGPRHSKKTKRVTEQEYAKAVDDCLHKRITEAQLDQIIVAYNRTIQEDRARKQG